MHYEWDETLETGNAEIDAQHKQLIAALNDLVDAREQGKGPQEIMRTLDFLSSYVVRHFNDEEAIQKKYDYPDYYRHRIYHDEFKKTVQNLVREINEKGPREELVLKTINTVAGWLINHIKGDDFKLAAYITSRRKE